MKTIFLSVFIFLFFQFTTIANSEKGIQWVEWNSTCFENIYFRTGYSWKYVGYQKRPQAYLIQFRNLNSEKFRFYWTLMSDYDKKWKKDLDYYAKYKLILNPFSNSAIFPFNPEHNGNYNLILRRGKLKGGIETSCGI